METYQGGSSALAPVEYVKSLRQWCTGKKALLVCDEIQAGFGRTGTLWGFEQYGIVPDLAVFGKGISGSLPLSAVAGRPDVMDLESAAQYDVEPRGQSGVLRGGAGIHRPDPEREPGAARRRNGASYYFRRLHALAARHPQIGCVAGKGLVAGLACVLPGSTEPDSKLAFDVVRRAMEKGVLMFAPVGFGMATVKICPPLVITADAGLKELRCAG